MTSLEDYLRYFDWRYETMREDSREESRYEARYERTDYGYNRFKKYYNRYGNY